MIKERFVLTERITRNPNERLREGCMAALPAVWFVLLALPAFGLLIQTPPGADGRPDEIIDGRGLPLHAGRNAADSIREASLAPGYPLLPEWLSSSRSSTFSARPESPTSRALWRHAQPDLTAHRASRLTDGTVDSGGVSPPRYRLLRVLRI